MNNLIYKVINYYQPGSAHEGVTQQISCIFKDNHSNMDEKKSARVYADSEKYHCFSCSITLDAIGLVKEMEEVDFKEAIRLIKERHNIDLSREYKEIPRDEDINAYRNVIVSLVIDKKLKNFNKIYLETDKAWVDKDIHRLKYLFEGVKSVKK